LLTLSGAPTADLHAATKKYVDDFAAAAQAFFVNVTGDTMTGDLTIQKATPQLVLNKTASGQGADVTGMLNGVRRWLERLGDVTAEAGANSGSNYSLVSYDDAGVVKDVVLTFSRSTGLGYVKANPVDPLGIATKQYVDAGGVAAVPFDAMAYSGLQVNGGFDVSQENGVTNVVTTGAGKYVCDLYLVTASAGVGTLTSSQVIGGSTNPGFNHMLRMTATAAFPFGAPTDVAFMMHQIEGFRWQRLAFGGANAKPVTIAFWILANATGIASVAVRNASSTRTYIAEFPVNAAGVWEYKTVTIPGCPDGVWEYGILVGGTIMFSFGSGVGAGSARAAAGAWNPDAKFVGNNVTNGFFGTINFAVQIQGLLVLPGSTAPTAAQHPGIVRTRREEIVLVQRYFRKFSWTQEGHSSSAQARVSCPHQIPEMRGPPSATRISLAASLNIRNADPNSFVTCAGASESCIVTGLESAAAGYIYAQGVIDNVSARF